MADLRLPYGEKTIPFSILERNLLGVVEGKKAPVIGLAEEFKRAWEFPIGSDDPAEFFHLGESVVFVVTDHTCATPTREIFSREKL